MSRRKSRQESVSAIVARESKFKRELAAISLTHPENCGCRVCRAAAGDAQALAELRQKP